MGLGGKTRTARPGRAQRRHAGDGFRPRLMPGVMRLARREQDLATKGARFIALGCSLLSWAWSIYLERGGIRMKRCALIFTTIVFGSVVAGAAVAQQKAQAK